MKYDRIILLVIAIAAIVAAVFIAMKASKFSERFVVTTPTPGTERPDTGRDMVQAAHGKLGEQVIWIDHQADGKLVPLANSVPLVEKDGVIFDILRAEPKLRPPMTNSFLREHSLEFLNQDVANLDPDGDGFSNLEEFEGGTSPVDAEEHPPLTDKLFVSERIEVPYTIMFAGATPPQYQIRRIDPKGRGAFVEKGGAFFDDGRFILEEYTPKEEINPNGNIPVDVSELTVTDTLFDEPVVMVFRQETKLPFYHAKFSYRLGETSEISVVRGESFSIPGSSVEYRLVSISEDQAIIEYLDDKGELVQIPISYAGQEVVEEAAPVDGEAAGDADAEGADEAGSEEAPEESGAEAPENEN